MKTPEEIRKENPFKVPEGYFDSLTERTMLSIKEHKKPVTLSDEAPARKIRVMPFIALAAAIVGFAVIAAGMVRLFSGNTNNIFRGSDQETYADLITEEIDTYIIESEWSVPEETSAEGEEIPDEVIIDYLLLDNVELTDIYDIL